MKRVISIILAGLVFISQMPCNYADATNGIKTPGQTLQELGLVSGYANGSLGESDTLTRAQMMVLIAQLKGENDMAKNYALPSSYIDVDPYAWYASYVAYAEAHKWTAGVSKNRFGPDELLTSQQAATFMLKILGYEVQDFKMVMDQAYALGILKNASISATEKITRGGVFQYMINTLNTPVANSSVNLGVSLGVLKPEKPNVNLAQYDVRSISALSNTLLEVKLNEATTAAETKQFTIRGANGTMLEIADAVLLDNKTIWLTTKAQTPGLNYTVTVNKEFKFLGMSRDTLAPTLVKDSSQVLDFSTVKLTFDKEMDPRSALNVNNYKPEGGITFLSARFEKDKDGKDVRTEVILTTSSQERYKLYGVIVQKQVTDISGNSVSTDSERNIFKFIGLVADTSAPRLASVYSLNANKIVALFDDQSDLDITNAENIGNYSVVNRTNANNGVNIVSAKLVKNTSNKYLMVELKTTQQIQGNNYELSVSNVTDKFGNVISGTSAYRASFTGQAADTFGPRMLFLQPISNTKVALVFDEDVTKETSEVTASYSIDNDLSVIKAERDIDNNKRVVLTTSSQISGRLYKVKAIGVTDEYGNVNSTSSNMSYFSGMYEDFSRPKIQSVTAAVEDSKTYAVVKFTKAMGDSAKIHGNYYFGSDIGYGLSVIKVSETEFKVRTNTQTEGKSYQISISNVFDAAGNAIDEVYYKANFFGKAVSDTEPPKINYAAAADRKTIRLVFNRAMQSKYTEVIRTSDGSPTDSDISDPDNYRILQSGNTTPIAVTKAYVDKDRMTVTLRIDSNAMMSDNSYSITANGNEASDPIDGSSTALHASNGIVLSNSYATYSFRGAMLDANKPRIAGAMATSTNTVEIRFNTLIKLTGLTSGGITVTGNGQTLVAIPEYTVVSTTDATVLKVRLSDKMTSNGNSYTVNISQVSAITDIYGDLTLDTSYGANSTTIYPNTIENEGPFLNSVVSNDESSITLKFSKELNSADVNDYIITTDAADITPTYAEFIDGNKDQVRLYFNNQNMSLGRAYRVKVPAYAIEDVYGVTNKYAQEQHFGITGFGRANVTISDFGAVGQSTVRLMFSKSIANVMAVTSGASFKVTNAPTGTKWIIEKAYDNGNVILPNEFGVIPQNTYFSMIDLKADKLIGKDTVLNIAFFTPLQFLAKDGAAIDGTPTKSTNGQLNLDTYKITSGVSAVDNGGGTIKVRVTDSSINVYNARTTYGKISAFAKLSTPTPYATQSNLVEGINNFDMTKVVIKGVGGTTDYNIMGLTSGTYDVVVVLYNQKNELVGYYLINNILVTN